MFWKRLKEKHSAEVAAEQAPSQEPKGEAQGGEPTAAILPADKAAAEREIALSPHLQSLWSSLFELVGVPQTQAGERPGLFTVTPGPNEGEALVHIDVPHEDYVEGEPPKMERIVTLSINLDHDHRLFGDDYYCVDCDIPDSETRH